MNDEKYYGYRLGNKYKYFAGAGVEVAFELREDLPEILTYDEITAALHRANLQRIEDINKARRAVGLPEIK